VSDEEYAYTLLNEADVLEEGGRFYEALALIERVLGMADEDEDALIAGALTQKAHVLGELEREDEKRATCDEVIERFAEQPELVAYARYYRAHDALERGMREPALEDVDLLLQHDPPDDVIVGDALLLKASILGGEDALALYDEVAERYAEDDSLAAAAMTWKAELLGELKRYAQGLQAARNVLARFDGATDLEVRERVAGAQMRIAYYLERMRRWPEALEAYDKLLAAFSPDESPMIAAMLDWAQEQRNALRVLAPLQRHAKPIRVGVAALVLFTVFRNGYRRDRERNRSVAVRLRQRPERG